MELVVIMIILKISIRYLRSKVDKAINGKVEMMEEIVHVTDLKH